MEKLIKDGKVAVLVSPGFGAGWSTWNSENREALAFDKDIAQAVLDGNMALAAKIGEDRYEAYSGGVEDLVVEWVPQGAAFEIEEYDGSETLHVIGERRYMVA